MLLVRGYNRSLTVLGFINWQIGNCYAVKAVLTCTFSYHMTVESNHMVLLCCLKFSFKETLLDIWCVTGQCYTLVWKTVFK